MCRANVYRWYACFRDGREDVKDDARSGRPSTAKTDENVESVRHLLTEDRRTTLQMVADRLNIGKEIICRIVTEDLGKRKICARFVPHALTTEQKQEHVVYCQDLLLMGQDEHFWEYIITGDETWCFAYDPATKECRVGGAKLSKTKETAILKIASEYDVNCIFRRRRCNSSRVCPCRAESKCRILCGCFGSATEENSTS